MSQPDHAAALAALRTFTDANATGDTAAMVGVLSRGTLEAGGFSGPMPQDFQFVFGPPESDADRVIIPLGVFPAGAPLDGDPMMALRCVMVQEGADWKFDLATTMQQMEAMIDAAMQEVGTQIGAAMGGAMDAIGDSLGAALGGPTASPEELEPGVEPFGIQDLQLVPELVRLEAATAAVSAAAGKDIPVLADMNGLLGLFGSTDPTAMTPWLDNEFCAGLGPAIAAAGDNALRLRSIRIDPANDHGEHFFAMDGADLVYRADPRYDDGWYRMQDDLLRIIPGVVLGMSLQDGDVPEGHTALPQNGFWPTVTRYRQAWAPRHMKDIRLMSGEPVALQADWESFYAESFDGRSLALWGLCRVPGAIALSMRDIDPPQGWLKAIRLMNGYDQKYAAFADGVLTMAIVGVENEKGCFYEHQLASVFAGEVIGTPPPPPEPSEP